MHQLQILEEWIKNDTTICCVQEIHLKCIMIGKLQGKGWEIHAIYINKRKVRVVVLIF